MPPKKPIPFAAFKASLENEKMKLENFTEAKVQTPNVFERMRAHLLKHYQGVEASRSYADREGQVWDCIPVELQPAVRNGNVKITLPRASSLYRPPTEAKKQKRNSASAGNNGCPVGYIPFRRLTLEELVRFKTLGHFFRKSPGRIKNDPIIAGAQDPDPTIIHKYAHAWQQVDNKGGHGFLNVWQPPITGDQVFSLSQHWYTAGADNALQTVEAGWHVYPDKYTVPGQPRAVGPRLFSYFTADNYVNTGCYNLECGKFIQNGGKMAPGSLLDASVAGGTQAELEICWELIDGQWLLWVGGLGPENNIGYYPVSVFNGGGMVSKATGIDFGGEVTGISAWSPMGSGVTADVGYGRAAYQRNISFFAPDGTATTPVLSPDEPSPNCYTIEMSTDPSWGAGFYFGGPGGSNCI